MSDEPSKGKIHVDSDWKMEAEQAKEEIQERPLKRQRREPNRFDKEEEEVQSREERARRRAKRLE